MQHSLSTSLGWLDQVHFHNTGFHHTQLQWNLLLGFVYLYLTLWLPCAQYEHQSHNTNQHGNAGVPGAVNGKLFKYYSQHWTIPYRSFFKKGRNITWWIHTAQQSPHLLLQLMISRLDNIQLFADFNRVLMLNIRPPQPRYTSIWSVDTLVNFVNQHPPSELLDLKELSGKTVMLMAITNDLNFRNFTEDGCPFRYLVYQTQDALARQGWYSIGNLTNIKTFICLELTIREYEKRTSELRKPTPEKDPLFIAITKPHMPVVSSTISRWMKNMMAEVGIDVSQFKAHSIRAAAMSAAAKVGVPIKDMLKTAN